MSKVSLGLIKNAYKKLSHALLHSLCTAQAHILCSCYWFGYMKLQVKKKKWNSRENNKKHRNVFAVCVSMVFRLTVNSTDSDVSYMYNLLEYKQIAIAKINKSAHQHTQRHTLLHGCSSVTILSLLLQLLKLLLAPHHLPLLTFLQLVLCVFFLLLFALALLSVLCTGSHL